MMKLFLSILLLASYILASEIDEIPKEVKDCLDKVRPIFARQLASVSECNKLPGIRNEDESAFDAFQNCLLKAYTEFESDLQSSDVQYCQELTESLSGAQVKAADKYLYNFATTE